MSGYSGTPLVKKLGIKPASRVLLAGAPPEAGALLADLPPDVVITEDEGEDVDVALLFVTRRADLETRFAPIARMLAPSGGLWVAWPKKSSGVLTDLGDGVVRRHGLDVGLVDNKVCAIDEVWSGLRFVIRVQDRPAKTRARAKARTEP